MSFLDYIPSVWQSKVKMLLNYSIVYNCFVTGFMRFKTQADHKCLFTITGTYNIKNM